MQPRLVMDIDPRRRHVGYAVIDHRLLRAGMWQFARATPALASTPGPEAAQTLLHCYRVQVLALEGWVKHGRWVRAALYVTRLMGALEMLTPYVLDVAREILDGSLCCTYRSPSRALSDGD